MFIKKPLLSSVFMICLWLLSLDQAQGQLRSGGSYLKLMPGARSQGIAETLTGTIDNMYAIYANPGATGLLREWQWSVSYTNWIPDVYNASLFLSKGFRFPWSRHSRLALGISYLGIKDFDSSKGRGAPLASGGDLLVAASYGQPISSISANLSLGGNIKFLRSRLDNFDANAFVFDVGLLYRTPRFRVLNTGFGFLDEGILSAGVSITQIGGSLQFKSIDTPLPRTFRAGLALNLGTHHGLQVHLTGEYRRIRDEDGYFSLGSELSWAQLLTLRGGYSFEKDNLLRHYALGLSLGLDDIRANLSSLLPGRNHAMQLDFARMESNGWFDAPYRGTVSHYPVVPEHFEFIEPALGETIAVDSTRLWWEASRDPDIYDEVTYWIFVDKDSAKLAQALRRFESQPRENFFALLASSDFMINDTLAQNNFLLENLAASSPNAGCSNDYFWTVAAYDQDRHYRIIEKSGQHIARFRVALPDLRIRITELHLEENLDELTKIYTGVATLVVSNDGPGVAKQVAIAVGDSISVLLAAAAPAITENPRPLDPVPPRIAELQPGARDSILVKWQTAIPDTHHLIAWVDKAKQIDECLENNNWAMQPVSLEWIRPRPTPLPVALAFSKNASKDTVQAGEVYRYSLRLANLGPVPARNVRLVDALPPYVTLLDGGLAQRDTLTWAIGALAEGADTTLSYSVKVDSLPWWEGPLNLEGVTFEFDKTRLTKEAKPALDKFARILAQYLNENPQDSLEIGGHTDSIGRTGYNDTLSSGRAESVRKYLVAKDPILFSRLTAKGYGEQRPIAPDTLGCQRQNRRVEITIPHQASKIPPKLVNWSQANAANETNHLHLVARDTVYVRSAPTALPSLQGVNFFSGSARLTPEAKQILDDAALALRRLLQKDPAIAIEIAGHTDNVGSDESNLQLSQARAESVRKYFIDKCIPPERMRTVGYGERNPIDVNTTPEGRGRNRRVELKTVTSSST